MVDQPDLRRAPGAAAPQRAAAGEALNDAARQIVHALVERIVSDARVEASQWPDRIPDLPEAMHTSRLESQYWARSTGLRRAVLEHLGWPYVNYSDLDDFLSLWRDYEDGLIADVSARSFHDRRALFVGSQALALSLNVQLNAPPHTLPAVWEPTIDASHVALHIKNLRLGNGLIAACDRIVITPEGREPIELKFIVTIEDEFDLPGLETLHGRAVVFAGDSSALWRELQQSLRLTNAAFLYSYYVGHDEWCDWVDGTDVLTSEIQAALVDGFIADFETTRRAAQVAWRASEDAYQHLREAQRIVDQARRMLKRRNVPRGFKGAKSVAALSRELKRTISELSRQAHKWKAATGIEDDPSENDMNRIVK